MYNAEVLSKFPVVQHFPFGYLFKWIRDPNAPKPTTTTHTSSQPQRSTPNPPSSVPGATTIRPAPRMDGGTKAPWNSAPTHRSSALPGPTASWTGQSGAPGMPATRAPWAGATPRAPPGATSRPAPVAGSSAGTGAPGARPAPALRPQGSPRKDALEEVREDGKE
jgi:serine/threonine-protein phosphatase 2A activator